VDGGAIGKQLHRTFEFIEIRQRKPQAPAGSLHSPTLFAQHAFSSSSKYWSKQNVQAH
jgi:hypothetical protein